MLREQPLCVHCLATGRIRAWDEMDHIDGDRDNNSWANFQPLCFDCHEVKTRKQNGYKVSGACDIDGFPKSIDHHWNKGKSDGT